MKPAAIAAALQTVARLLEFAVVVLDDLTDKILEGEQTKPPTWRTKR